MSARASARTVRPAPRSRRRGSDTSHGASTTASPARASTVMAITSGSSCSRFCWATTMPNAAPTRPEPDDDPDDRRPAAAGHEGRQPDLAAALGPPTLLLAVSACRHTRAAPAQAKATGQNRCWLIPSRWSARSTASPMPSAARASSVPQSSRRCGLAAVRIPLRLAASSPGADVGRLGRHQQPQRPVRDRAEELDQQQTRRNRCGSPCTGQPRCRASPVQTPPSTAPSATRVARGRACRSGIVAATGSGPASGADQGR